MNPASAAVALVTAEHHTMTAQQFDLLDDLDRADLEAVVLTLAGWVRIDMCLRATEGAETYDQLQLIVDYLIRDLALDVATS